MGTVSVRAAVLRPTGRDVSNGQGVAVIADRVAALVPDQIDLHESGHGVIPLRQVRIGIWDFSSEPGLVCDRPRSVIFARSAAGRRSMVAGDIAINAHATSSVIISSRQRRSVGTSSAMVGASRLPRRPVLPRAA